MASRVTSIVLAVLFYILAVGARTNLDKQSSDLSISKILPLVDEASICNLVVEKQGYICQEHKVCL